MQIPDAVIVQPGTNCQLDSAAHLLGFVHLHPTFNGVLAMQSFPQSKDVQVMDKIERPIAIDRGPIKLGLFYSMWCTSDSPTRSIHELCAYGNGCLYAVVDTLGSDALDYALSTTTQTHILHSKYCKALNLVQRALESPVEAKKDHVLIAVLLMGTVEAKISPQKAVEDWVTHIQGASDLLHLRGPDQVSTGLGAALYLQASTQVFTTCLLTGLALPDQFLGLAKQVLQGVPNPRDVIWRHHATMVTFVDFVCSESEKVARSWNYPFSALDVILRALEIHQKLRSMFDDAPSIWKYKITKVDQGVQHTYSSCLAAQIW